MGKNIGKNISKNSSGKYSQKLKKLQKLQKQQKLLDHAKQSVTDVFKTSSKIAIQKPAEATGDFVGNKIANKITVF